MGKYLLSIDCGTQSIRALVFDTSGHLLMKEQVAYPPYVSPGPGLAEQDPDVYWNGLIQACRQLKEKEPELMGLVFGVGITTQRATMINVDRQGQVLRPAIVWLDQRAASPEFATSGLLGFGVKLARLKDRLMEAQAQAKCNWIRQNQPQIWADTHKYLQVSGYLNFKLTGLFADSVASQIGHLPFDYKKQAWAGPLGLTRKLFPIEAEKLPNLVSPGTVIGTVTKEAANQTGLPFNIPVIACGSDKGCETLGSGVVDQTMVSLSFGTTATVQTTSQRYFEAIPLMPPYPAPVPGCYNPEVEIFRGFWMISWFKKEFAHKEVETAKTMGIAPEELLNQCLDRTEPGAMGLIVQPYWGPGLDHPNAKGAMIGFGDAWEREVARAAAEGGDVRPLEYEVTCKSGETRSVMVSGTAIEAFFLATFVDIIAADIFNLPMHRAATHETSGLGAAVLTAVGVGEYETIQRAASQMTRPAGKFMPNPNHVTIYKRLYRDVYQNMYQALSPLYKQIQKITGYPAK